MENRLAHGKFCGWQEASSAICLEAIAVPNPSGYSALFFKPVDPVLKQKLNQNIIARFPCAGQFLEIT